MKELNDRAVLTLEDWSRVLEPARGRTRPLVLLVSRGGVVSYVAIRMAER